MTGLPPGPRRPALAQTIEWVLDPDRFMRRCRERYGSTFTARLGPSADVVFLCEPDDVKTVFQGTPEQTNMGDINGLFRRVLGQNSLLVIDGDEHLRQRRLLLPPFHGERIAEHYGAMVQAAEEDVAAWQEGQALTLQPHMQAMTLNVILAAVFGLGPGERRDRFRVLLARLLELNTTLATTLPQLRVELGGRSPWGKLMRCTAEVDELVYEEIARRRAQSDRPGDVLSLLLDAQDADGGDAMTDSELRDQLLTMLVAGHETTATALAWAFERLLRSPAVLVRTTARAGPGQHDLPGCGDQGDAAAAAGGADHRAQAHGAVRGRRARLRAGHGADAVHLPAAPPPGHLRAARRSSCPSASWARARRRTPGSRSAAASAAAWARGSRWRRCGRSCRRCSTRVELRPEREQDERVVRRAFTISPREGARVVVQQRLPA